MGEGMRACHRRRGEPPRKRIVIVISRIGAPYSCAAFFVCHRPCCTGVGRFRELAPSAKDAGIPITQFLTTNLLNWHFVVLRSTPLFWIRFQTFKVDEFLGAVKR